MLTDEQLKKLEWSLLSDVHRQFQHYSTKTVQVQAAVSDAITSYAFMNKLELSREERVQLKAHLFKVYWELTK